MNILTITATVLATVFFVPLDMKLSMEYARTSAEMAKLTQVHVMMVMPFQEMAAVQCVLSKLDLSARIL
jgi:hypothetical protein